MIVGRTKSGAFGRLRGTDDGSAIVREGRSPCFVAFHGFTGTTSEIRPVVDAVAARGYAVRAPLLPGHGETPDRLQNTTFSEWTDAMQRELDAAIARHENVVLCGFSLGSLVAIELAARRPRGLLGLVLLGNALTLAPYVSGPLGFWHRRGWKLGDWYFLKLWSADLADREQRERISAYDRDPIRAAMEVYRAGLHCKDRLRHVDVPVLVLHGARDKVCPVANVEHARRALGSREIRTKIFPKSAHMLAADLERDEVSACVASWVAEMEQRRHDG
ncbi:MAG TPA: alpha/beta fold hydrolase [Labilithrix sp.]